MAYVPIADADLNPPIAGNASVWTELLAQDPAAYALYAPGFESNPLSDSRTGAREYRFRVWGNRDVLKKTDGTEEAGTTLAFSVRAKSSSGSKTVTVTDSTGVTENLTVSTEDWYTTASTAWGGTVGDAAPLEVVLSTADPAPQTMTFYAIRCAVAGSNPSAGLYRSGYRKLGSLWSTAANPIPSEVVSRLRTNAIAIARSRPVCVTCHISDTVKAISAKSLDVWGNYDSTSWARVGRLVVPKADEAERWYLIDAYTTETIPGTAEFSVRVGSQEKTFYGPGWHAWNVRLGRGPHEVWANIKAGASNGAAIRTLQVWRTQMGDDGGGGARALPVTAGGGHASESAPP